MEAVAEGVDGSKKRRMEEGFEEGNRKQSLPKQPPRLLTCESRLRN